MAILKEYSMKQVVLNIPDKYAGILTVTCVGFTYEGTNVTVQAFDIRNLEDNAALNIISTSNKPPKPINNLPATPYNEL